MGIIAQIYRPKKSTIKAKNVVFVVVSIAKETVRNALFETLNHVVTNFPNYRVWVVVDEGAELIPELKLRGYDLIIVPKEYRRDLIGKGRAINYFIESVVEDDKWYAFIDDDNLILDDSFLYEIPYYEKLGYVAMNPILVPRRGKSTVTYIMDFIRYFEDVSVFRFFMGLLKKPLVGFHGELLTVKGSILQEIKYDKPSITEDFRFACEVVRKGYKVWQSTTIVSIKSPNSILDLLKQRGRWFKGVVCDVRNAPTIMKIIVLLRLAVWIVGVFGSWALVPLWIFYKPFFYALPGGIAYWLIYLYGVSKAHSPSIVAIIPVFGIIESMSWLFGLRQKSFVVIDKN
ncbi:MAG: egghead protein [Thermoprotei archaeon]|nr:MAG: egghead protein [Thermoprotei archaeon]